MGIEWQSTSFPTAATHVRKQLLLIVRAEAVDSAMDQIQFRWNDICAIKERYPEKILPWIVMGGQRTEREKFEDAPE